MGAEVGLAEVTGKVTVIMEAEVVVVILVAHLGVVAVSNAM